MGYRELNEIVNNLPDSFREDLKDMVRIRNFNEQDTFKLFDIIRSKTLFDDLFDHIASIINSEDEVGELQSQLDEMSNIIWENKEHERTIENLKKRIESLKERPICRAQNVKTFVEIFYEENNRFPTFDEVWKQAQLETEEKYGDICDKFKKCARTQFCKEDGDTCYEKKLP